MRSIKTVKNQNIFGIALQEYGNILAFKELLRNNDLVGKMNQLTFVPEDEVDLGYSLFPSVVLDIDDASPMRNEMFLEALGGREFADGYVLEYYTELLNIFKDNVLQDGGTIASALDAIYSIVSNRIDYNAALLIMPGAYKEGVIYGARKTGSYFAIPFSRASAATGVIADDGTFYEVGTNVPRLSKNAETGNSCYLLEPATTNLMTGADLLEKQTGGTGVVASPETSILPGNTVNRLNSGYVGRNVAMSSFGYYTFSAYVKREGVNQYAALIMAINNSVISPYYELTLNFDTLSTSIAEYNYSSINNAGFRNVSGAVEAHANGWYRISLTLEYYAGTNSAVNAGVSTTLFHTTSFHYTCWQFENHAFVTSYVPCPSGQQATRVADSIDATGLQAAGLFGVNEGTLIFHGSISTDKQIALKNAGSTVRYNLSGDSIENVADVQTTTDGQAIDEIGGWRYKHGSNDTIAHDGTVYKGSNSATPVAIDKLTITPLRPMLLEALILFPVEISDVDLQQLTS